MGLTQSVAGPVRAADEALFGERELSALRETFAFLAAAHPTHLQLHILGPPLLPAALPWPVLREAFAEAEGVRSEGLSSVLSWDAFLRGVATFCKSAGRHQRLLRWIRLYAPSDTALDHRAVCRFLSGALAASRWSEEQGRADDDAQATLEALVDAELPNDGAPAARYDSALPALSAAARDALLDAPSVGRVEHFARWIGSQLPALHLAFEACLLDALCALGSAATTAGSTAGSSAGSSAGGSSAVAAIGSASNATASNAPASQIASRAAAIAPSSPTQEPLLEHAGREHSVNIREDSENIREDYLLTRGSGWLLGLWLGPPPAGEARSWRSIYDSRDHGLSLNRFSHHALGYAGPSLLLARVEGGAVLGAYLDVPWKATAQFWGGVGCALVQLSPSFHVFAPAGGSANYAYFNPPQTGRSDLACRHESAPKLVGFGGQLQRFRLSLEDDLQTLRWHARDTCYEAASPGRGPSEGLHKLEALELWGCGGVAAAEAQRAVRERADRSRARAGTVDRGALFGVSKGEANPDAQILEAAGVHTFYSHTLEKLPSAESER